jgi:hypothetical protein
MPNMLSDAQVESLADALAALMVAEFRAKHPIPSQGHIPHRDLSISIERDAKSSTYGTGSTNHEPASKPTSKVRGPLSLVPWPRRGRPIQR